MTVAPCKCGCGQAVERRPGRGRPREYANRECQERKYQRPCKWCRKPTHGSQGRNGKRAPLICRACNSRFFLSGKRPIRNFSRMRLVEAQQTSKATSRTSTVVGNANACGISTFVGDDAFVCRLPISNRYRGEPVQEAQALRAELARIKAAAEADIHSLANDLAAKNREIGRLKRELSTLREEEPNAKEVKDLLLHWKAMTGKNGRTYIGADGKRWKVTKAALKRHGFEMCQKAVDGLAARPYLGPKGGRYAHLPAGGERKDDIEYALGDETRVERCCAYLNGAVITAAFPATDLVSTEDVLAKLEATRKEKPDQWIAKCPAHDDRHASLSVAHGTHRTVCHCHTGCTEDAVLAALHLTREQLIYANADERPLPTATLNRDPLPSEDQLRSWQARFLGNVKLVARVAEVRGWSKPTLQALGVGFDGERLVFPVRDSHGHLLTAVFYKPGGKPKTIGLKGRSRGLFPAPESFTDPVLWLVEGEPDAVAMAELGLAGVGVPGVNGWRMEWVSRFAGRGVVVCFDCDNPGRTAAVKIAEAVALAAREVRVVDLDSDRDDGFDVSDWLLAGGTKAGLVAMARFAQPISSDRLAA
jgi:hypothetical protein